MRLDNMVRAILPPKARQVIGGALLKLVAQHYWTLKLYMYLLHGYSAKNMKVGKGYVEYLYNDHRVLAPPDGAGSFFEVYHESVYDAVFSPKEGDIVFDVGAYVGMWTVRAALAVGNSGDVHAFEPSGDNLVWLRRNIKGLPVVVHPIVVTDYDGSVTLYMSRAGACNSIVMKVGKPSVVVCRKLDTIAKTLGLDKVDFIKIDAEGAELQVLRGAENLLKQGAIISIAAYHELGAGQSEYSPLVDYLHSQGYQTQTKSGLRGYIYAKKAN